MKKKQSKMIFLFCSFFFILGLNLHSVDGLAEFHDLITDKIVAADDFCHDTLYNELVLLHKVEKEFEMCQTKYNANNEKYQEILEQVLDPISTNYSNMLEVTEEVKVFIMCSKMFYKELGRENDATMLALFWITEILALLTSYTYLQGYLYYKEKDEEFAKLLAEHSATLAAVGGNPSNEVIYEKELKEYLHTVEKDGSTKSDVDLPYIELVNLIRSLIYANYDNFTKSFDINPSEYRDTFKKIEEYGDLFTSYIADMLFANEKIHPGSEVRKPKYGKPSFQQMWDSENFKEAIRNIKLPWAQPVVQYFRWNPLNTKEREKMLDKVKVVPKKPTDEKKEEEKDVEKSQEDPEKSTEEKEKEPEVKVPAYEVTNIPLQLIREVEAQMIQLRPLPDAERDVEELKRNRRVTKLRRGYCGESENPIYAWLVEKDGHKPILLFSYTTLTTKVTGDGMELSHVEKKYNVDFFERKK